ncbi:uncharacterized protein WM294_006899 [Sarcoramphus papa]
MEKRNPILMKPPGKVMTLVHIAGRTASPNAAPDCPEPETCSSPLEVTATPVKIHEGLEGIRMQREAGSSHGDGRRDADKCANERLSCAEPLILLLLLDYLWQKVRLGRLQINQAAGCLLVDYFCRRGDGRQRSNFYMMAESWSEDSPFHSLKRLSDSCRWRVTAELRIAFSPVLPANL